MYILRAILRDASHYFFESIIFLSICHQDTVTVSTDNDIASSLVCISEVTIIIVQGPSIVILYTVMFARYLVSIDTFDVCKSLALCKTDRVYHLHYFHIIAFDVI